MVIFGSEISRLRSKIIIDSLKRMWETGNQGPGKSHQAARVLAGRSISVTRDLRSHEVLVSPGPRGNIP